MSRLEVVNLIRLFDFYLAVMFLLSFARRYMVYWDALVLLVSLRGRWPNLVARLKEHHGVLVTGEVLRPLAVALAMTLIQMVCSRLIWPEAKVTLAVIEETPWQLVVLVVAMIPMVLVDLYFVIRVGRFDRGATEQYLDLAEGWLAGWKGTAVRAATLGYINPRRMVDDEVKKGLVQLGATVSWASRWVAIQVGCRLTFGLTIWLLWAAGGE